MPAEPASPKPTRFEYPPLGKPYLLAFDQNNPAFPIIAVHLDPRVGAGMTVPALFSACPYQGYTALVFVGEKTVEEGTRVMRTYRILPGATVVGATIDIPDPRDERFMLNDNESTTTQTVKAGTAPTNPGPTAYGSTSEVKPVDDATSTETNNASSKGYQNTLTASVATEETKMGVATVTETQSVTGLTADTGLLVVESTVEARGLGWQLKRTTARSSWGWIYGSHVDPRTNIVGSIAKTYVANSAGNVAAIAAGPQTINGMTFGNTEDMVVTDYQEYDEQKTILLVTVFSATQIAALTEATIVEGSYPLPPTLTGVVVHNDTSSWAYAYTGANYSWQLDIPINGQLELKWSPPPTKLIGIKTRTYHIGAPSASGLTQIISATGEIVILSATIRSKQDAWANATDSGSSAAGSVNSEYGLIHVPECFVDATTVFGSLPAPSIPTVTLSGYTVVFSSLTGNAGFATNIASSSPVSMPATIVEAASEKQDLNIYILDVITWTT